jgi:uncharacterized membrane protein
MKALARTRRAGQTNVIARYREKGRIMKRLMGVGLLVSLAIPLTVHAQSLDDTTMKFLRAGNSALDASNAAPP